MKKEVVVLSLGGSLIIPDKIDLKYLRKFKKVILKNSKKYKFIISCGGGSVARKYISALRQEGINHKLQSYSGISATRMNARFMAYFFNKDPEYGIPHTTETLKKYLKKHGIVFCGALEYKPKQTSDSTAAKLAKTFNALFINLTNVPGLYDKNPKKYKNAKFIPKITWKNFEKIAKASKYQPGQHFVLDQTAAEVIRKEKIKTYILGKDLNQLENVLKKRKFKGTLVFG